MIQNTVCIRTQLVSIIEIMKGVVSYKQPSLCNVSIIHRKLTVPNLDIMGQLFFLMG